jgi:hypothetical protein
MSNLDFAQESYKEIVGKFLLGIQTKRLVDFSLFQEVEKQTKLLASFFKDQELVSKSLLNELHTAAKILRTEAPFVKDKSAELIKMAEQLELIFDLILRGEVPSDRIPGVPRLI